MGRLPEISYTFPLIDTDWAFKLAIKMKIKKIKAVVLFCIIDCKLMKGLIIIAITGLELTGFYLLK
jgi:hypothetical protein